MESLCKSCVNVREVVSGTGSTFMLCRLAQTDKRFPKYPPQPVVRCDGYEDMRKALTTFTLEVLPGTFAECRLSATDPVPDWATGEFVSITRTPNELSIVCPQANVPAETQSEPGWRCLRVAGQLDFSMVGVIASLKCHTTWPRISVLTKTVDWTKRLSLSCSSISLTMDRCGSWMRSTARKQWSWPRRDA